MEQDENLTKNNQLQIQAYSSINEQQFSKNFAKTIKGQKEIEFFTNTKRSTEFSSLFMENFDSSKLLSPQHEKSYEKDKQDISHLLTGLVGYQQELESYNKRIDLLNGSIDDLQKFNKEIQQNQFNSSFKNFQRQNDLNCVEEQILDQDFNDVQQFNIQEEQNFQQDDINNLYNSNNAIDLQQDQIPLNQLQEKIDNSNIIYENSQEYYTEQTSQAQNTHQTLEKQIFQNYSPENKQVIMFQKRDSSVSTPRSSFYEHSEVNNEISQENSEFKSQIKSFINNLNAKLNQLQTFSDQTIQQMNKKLEYSQKQIQDLQHENDKQKETLQQKNNTIENLQQQLKELNDSQQKQEAVVNNEQQQKIKKLSQLIHKLNEENQILKKKNQQIIEQSLDVFKENQESKSRNPHILNQQNEIEYLNTQNVRNVETQSKIEEKYKNLQKDYKECIKQLKLIVQEKKLLQKQVKDQETQILSLTQQNYEELKQFSDEIEDLKQKQSESTSSPDKSQLKIQLDILEKNSKWEINKLTQKVMELQELQTRLKDELQKYIKRLKDTQTDRTKFENEVYSKNQLIQTFKLEILNLKQIYSQSHQQYLELLEEYQQIQKSENSSKQSNSHQQLQNPLDSNSKNVKKSIKSMSYKQDPSISSKISQDSSHKISQSTNKSLCRKDFTLTKSKSPQPHTQSQVQTQVKIKLLQQEIQELKKENQELNSSIHYLTNLDKCFVNSSRLRVGESFCSLESGEITDKQQLLEKENKALQQKIVQQEAYFKNYCRMQEKKEGKIK